jgi:hypothetical protein
MWYQWAAAAYAASSSTPAVSSSSHPLTGLPGKDGPRFFGPQFAQPSSSSLVAAAAADRERALSSCPPAPEARHDVGTFASTKTDPDAFKVSSSLLPFPSFSFLVFSFLLFLSFPFL